MCVFNHPLCHEHDVTLSIFCRVQLVWNPKFSFPIPSAIPRLKNLVNTHILSYLKGEKVNSYHSHEYYWDVKWKQPNLDFKLWSSILFISGISVNYTVSRGDVRTVGHMKVVESSFAITFRATLIQSDSTSYGLDCWSNTSLWNY